jgi:hypothetical protein
MGFPYIASLSWEAITTEYEDTKTFRIGQLGMTEDGSLYRLCKAGAALNAGIAAGNDNDYTGTSTDASLETGIYVAIAAGDESANIKETNSRAANYWKDGYIHTFGTEDQTRHIWKSDAGDGTSNVIYVSSPFTTAEDADAGCDLVSNPWNNVAQYGALAQGYEGWVCVPPLDVTSGYYFWGQVRGVCYVRYGPTTWLQADAYDQDAVFHIGGTLRPSDELWNDGKSGCRAGHSIIGGNYGNQWIMLQLE